MKTTTTISLSTDVLEAVKKKAAEESRNTSGQIEHWLKQVIAERKTQTRKRRARATT
jgi:hypothetical protein